MTDKEHEFVEEWVEESVTGTTLPLDQLVSLYGYALLGLEEADEAVMLKIKKKEEEANGGGKDGDETKERQEEEPENEGGYEYPKRKEAMHSHYDMNDGTDGPDEASTSAAPEVHERTLKTNEPTTNPMTTTTTSSTTSTPTTVHKKVKIDNSVSIVFPLKNLP
ncbi:unnamed protein product [Caenorhabditis sp. 36 PRJEB53466]|nr:unnamed protein product [Caenorhabditis sp. 36 PRJEB53466]